MKRFMVAVATIAWCASTGTGAPPSPEYMGLRLGNHWTFSDGTEVWIDRVDSTPEGWLFHRLSRVVCQKCPDRPARMDTSAFLVRGDTVFQSGSESEGRWEIASVPPIQVGSRWQLDELDHDTLRVLGRQSLTVPAGTFPGCLHARTTSGFDLWLHKDIGLVRLADSSAPASELQSFQPGR